MASQYSALKIQLMATGENSGTWGNVTNDNLGVAIEEAIAESADVTFSGSNVSITLSDTNASQVARNLRLNLTGTSVAATQALTVPDIEKPYIVNNGLTDDVEVKNSTGSNVTVPAGKTMWVYSTGAGVVDAMNAGENLTGLNAYQCLIRNIEQRQNNGLIFQQRIDHRCTRRKRQLCWQSNYWCQCQRQLPSNSRWLYAGQVFRRCSCSGKYWSRNDH
jgi:hypothetical protein